MYKFSVSASCEHGGNVSRSIEATDQLELSYWLTCLLTPWTRVLEKPTGPQLVKNFTAFYGTWRFITAFKSARHLSLSWASSIQSIHPHPTSWRSILILSPRLLLGLPSGLFPSVFLTKTLHTPLLSTIRATCPTQPILLDLITLNILGEEHRSSRTVSFWKYVIYNKFNQENIFQRITWNVSVSAVQELKSWTDTAINEYLC